MPYRKKILDRLGDDDIDWRAVQFFIGVHAIGLYGLYYAYHFASYKIIVASILLYLYVHLSITCGTHRLFAHPTYWASAPLRYVLAIGHSGSWQGPIVWWAGKHLCHHHLTDRAQDVHSPTFYDLFRAHIGWLLLKSTRAPAPARYTAHLLNTDNRYYDAVRWQRDHSWWLIPTVTFVAPTAIGFLIGDWFGGLLVGGFTRLMFQYHFTWVVNSFCHYWGESKGGSATNLRLGGILPILTVGESLHAEHHANVASYRFGKNWYDLDIGAWFIELCMLLRLAKRIA